jgi:hypothetical protein
VIYYNFFKRFSRNNKKEEKRQNHVIVAKSPSKTASEGNLTSFGMFRGEIDVS